MKFQCVLEKVLDIFKPIVSFLGTKPYFVNLDVVLSPVNNTIALGTILVNITAHDVDPDDVALLTITCTGGSGYFDFNQVSGKNTFCCACSHFYVDM